MIHTCHNMFLAFISLTHKSALQVSRSIGEEYLQGNPDCSVRMTVVDQTPHIMTTPLPAEYQVSPRFRSERRPLRASVVYLSRSRQMSDYYLKTGHDRFLPIQFSLSILPSGAIQPGLLTVVKLTICRNSR